VSGTRFGSNGKVGRPSAVRSSSLSLPLPPPISDEGDQLGNKTVITVAMLLSVLSLRQIRRFDRMAAGKQTISLAID